MIVDNTFTEKDVYDELDHAVMNIIGAEVTPAISEPAEEVSLSESLAAAHETGAAGIVTKQSIMDHLAATFGEKVDVHRNCLKHIVAENDDSDPGLVIHPIYPFLDRLAVYERNRRLRHELRKPPGIRTGGLRHSA